MARRWDSQQLGVLVLVPLIVLAPVVTDGITLLLVGFMLALAAVSLPVQLGKDWIWLHCARIAASTFPLLIALLALHFDDRRDLWLVGACAIAAGLAIVAALILLPRTSNRVLMALVTGAGVLPVLCVALVADRVVAALMAVVLAAVLLAIVLIGDRLPGVDGAVRPIWAALSAISATDRRGWSRSTATSRARSCWRWRSSWPSRRAARRSRDGLRSASPSSAPRST